MISVKGAKTEPTVTDPAAVYRLKEAARASRMPFGIGGLFAAIALYFETALATSASAPMAEAPPPPGDDTVQAFTDKQQAVGPRLAQAETPPADDPAPLIAVAQFAAGSAPPPGGHFAPKAAPEPAPAALDLAAGPATPKQKPTGTPAALTSNPNAGSGGTEQSVDAPTPPNAAPTSDRPLFLDEVASGGVLSFSAADLLAYISDAEGDALSVGLVRASSGSLVQTSTGYEFRADDETLGPVQLTYRVGDGTSVINVVAQISVVPNAILGTAADDALTGTAWRDELRAGEGNDQLRGMGGSDFLFGGAGMDTLTGEAGNDVLHGEHGNDILDGGDGIDGLWGGEGDDWLLGGNGADLLFGEAGNDHIADGLGADVVSGGQGDDRIIAALDFADDHYDGDEDIDTLDYSAATVALLINLRSGQATGSEIGTDTFVEIETVVTGSGDDHFLIGPDSVVLAGGAGDNIFEFAEADATPADTISLYEILDFDVGDVIVSPKFDIFACNDAPETSLSDAMSPDRDSDGGRIRYRYEGYDNDDRRTVVEWEGQESWHLTVVTMNGHQILTWTEHGA